MVKRGQNVGNGLIDDEVWKSALWDFRLSCIAFTSYLFFRSFKKYDWLSPFITFESFESVDLLSIQNAGQFTDFDCQPSSLRGQIHTVKRKHDSQQRAV